MNLQTNIRTITLSITLALIAGTLTATTALASDNAGNMITAQLGTVASSQTSTVVTEALKPTATLAEFFGPDPKRVLVREYVQYEALKQQALADNTTTAERVAKTEIIVLPEYAAKFGIGDIDSYAVERGLVTAEERSVGDLAYNDKVLMMVFADITARSANGELNFSENVTATQGISASGGNVDRELS